MRIGGFNTLSTIDTNGESISFVIYFQGCSRHCPGCHNPELQDFNGGVEMTTKEIVNKIKDYRDWYKAVVFQGGEPLEQVPRLYSLLVTVKSLGLETWLYTGFDYEEIPDVIKDECDVIVAGAFVEELKTGGFPASSNQVIYRINK